MDDPMLATSNKMTGLDLATRSAERDSKRSMNEEMLSTPKIPDSAGGLVSPKFLSYTTSSSSSSSRPSHGGPNGGGNDRISNGDDMLMTPVLTTPNTADVWCNRKPSEIVDFSPENLSTTSELDLGPREPPKDLPMDSDIGLRSPCDGLLAKRRKQMREMNKRPGSFNSDSNSCDTPTSENSPRDLTTGPPRNGHVSLENHRRLSPATTNNSPTTSSSKSFEPLSPRPMPPLLPPPPLSEDRRYTNFKKPANLQIVNGAMKENDLPAHYNPSPLAVPSPNWSAVERYFGGGEIIKTPKNLDNNVFDFLGLPPSTPRSAKLYRDRSPNHPVDCYSGRDQRLSPRLSPRFPIPVAPTDLSGRPPPVGEQGVSNEAQDLSTRSSKSRTMQMSPTLPPPPPQPSQSPVVQIVQPPPLMQRPPAPVKIEYDHTPPHSTSPEIQSVPAPRVAVKTENLLHAGASTSMEDYDYSPHIPHVPPPPAPCYPNSFYLPSGFHPGYPRHIYGHPESDRPSPPTVASPSRPPFDRSNYHPHQVWPGMLHQSHHLNLAHHIPHHQTDLHLQHGSSGGGLVINPHPWTTPIKEEVSSSPPPLTSSLLSHYQTSKANLSIKSGDGERKKSPRKFSSDTEEKRGRKKSKTKIKKEAETAELAPGESKRVYTCPHCQRSYDWNYNLNRHLKYECGKENAFQCAKCGRKFPHKQNCVYHLKRKHKVVLDTIDQYMSAGLVLFRGASDTGGHTEARPFPSV